MDFIFHYIDMYLLGYLQKVLLHLFNSRIWNFENTFSSYRFTGTYLYVMEKQISPQLYIIIFYDYFMHLFFARYFFIKNLFLLN